MRPISQVFRCIDEIAKRGSIRKAAENLNLSSSAVNQQLLNFEESLGVPVFDRLSNGVKLTTAGEIMLTAMRRGQREFDNALSQVEDLRALRRGHVNLGVPHAAAEVLLPGVIKAALKSYPGITYTITTGNSEQIVEWLSTGEIDIGYCLRHQPQAGVEEMKSWPVQLGVVMHPAHPLCKREKLRFRDCLSFPLAMPSSRMEIRTLIDSMASRTNRPIRPVVESTSVAMLRALVEEGVAISFLPIENVSEDVRLLRLVWVPLQDAEAKTHSCLYRRSGESIPVAVGVFVEFLDAAFNQLGRRL